MSVKLRINHAGGPYDNGRSPAQLIGERFLDLHHEDVSQKGIAQELSTSRHFVQNGMRDCDATNTSCQPAKSHRGHSVLTPSTIECIESEKLCEPSVYCAELQNRLVLDGVVHPDDLPHASTIRYFLRKELLMTKNKIHSLSFDSKIQALEEYTSFYLDQANFTVNLMHSCLGVDYVSVIEGASNGNKLLLFFEEAVGITRRDGSVIFERGDTVIMDNCPFHHAKVVGCFT
ncbi:uncharacterized protein LOC110054023 [Orbicella faveolata]|uniref:uncharacterized protein LOC110054022 n=1 Tax=Orbicella faveolata TaxID=48498 RepID=UPI0009E1B72A|nr:uncharacterized protein LOC110054022 [Orbicella faveolata]XP_020616012.1 uncharacterized protein LOC110054023 [Orbicella faveolata]